MQNFSKSVAKKKQTIPLNAIKQKQNDVLEILHTSHRVQGQVEGWLLWLGPGFELVL